MSTTDKFRNPFIRLLVDDETPREQVVALIHSANTKQFMLLWELIYNLLHNNIQIEDNEFQQIKRFKSVYDKLLESKSKINRQRILTDNSKVVFVLIKPLRRFLQQK